MARRLIFSINREMMRFIIIDKNILYTDRKFQNYIRCIPTPKNFLLRIKMSRNKFPSALADLFNLTEEEKKEYNNAKGEDELAEIIIRDCRMKGAALIMNVKEDNSKLGDIKFID